MKESIIAYTIVAIVIIILATIGFTIQYKINDKRFPDTPMWTKFFR